MANIRMRAMQPLFVNHEITVVGKPKPDGSGCEVWALCPDGTIAQEILVSFEDSKVRASM